MFERKTRDPLEHRRSVLPEAVFDAEPSPQLAAFLSVIDPAELSGHDQILVLRAHQRLVSHFTAKMYEDIAALSEVMFEFDDDLELASHATAMELRAALRLTRRMAEMELDFARELFARLPRVAEALESGDIDVRRARVLVDGSIHLEVGDARRIVDQVIDRAGELTTGELRARVAKLCMAVDPEAADKQYQAAHDERKLVRDSNVSGTASITLLDVAPNKAGQAMDRINTLAKSLHVGGETRTMDQLRADIALDLLCGTTAHQNAKAGAVTVNVDLDTLARLSEMPGDLGGYGPVIADIARQTAEAAESGEWRFRVSDPDSGLPVHGGVTRKRRHSVDQRRTVELRDEFCAFPGCRTPSKKCDVDHSKRWAETHQTSAEDSAPLDRHDHVGRHQFDWTYKRLPNGDYVWRSRLGHLYTKSGRPPPQ